MWKPPHHSSAMQHRVRAVRELALDVSWMQVLCGPFLKESVELDKTTPTAHFEYATRFVDQGAGRA